MPLLKKRWEWSPRLPAGAVPEEEGAAPGERLLLLQPTGERFSDQAAYDARAAELAEPVWQCVVTGAGEMTYDEAAASEAEAAGLWAEVPSGFWPALARAAQHSELELDPLVTRLLGAMKEVYLPGEQARAANSGMWCACEVKAEVKAAAGGEPARYAVVLGGKQKGKQKEVPAPEMRRDKAPATRPALRSWVLAHFKVRKVGGLHCWEASPATAAAHGLSSTLTAEFEARGAAEAAKELARAVRKRKPGPPPEDEPRGKRSVEGPSTPVDEQGKEAPPSTQKKPPPAAEVTSHDAVELEVAAAAFKAGTAKAACRDLLEGAGTGGMHVAELMRRATEAGTAWWSGEGSVNSCCGMLEKSEVFVRVAPRTFALRKTGAAEWVSGMKSEGGAEKAPRKPAARTGGADPKMKEVVAEQQAAVKAVQAAEDRLDQAREDATSAAEKWATGSTPTSAKSVTLSAEEEAQFALPPELAAYTGSPDDRKALMAHKLRVEKERAKLEHARDAFLAAKKKAASKARSKRESEALKQSSAVRDAEAELAKARKRAARADAALVFHRAQPSGADSAVDTSQSAVLKELEKLAKLQERATTKAAKEKAKADEKAERERLRELQRLEREREKAEAARYPVEEEALAAELAARGEHRAALPVPGPCAEGLRASEEVAAAEFLRVFHRSLSLEQAVSVKRLHELVEAPASADLAKLFIGLLDGILPEEEATRRQARWKRVLTVYTWPEVLRQLLEWRLKDLPPASGEAAGGPLAVACKAVAALRRRAFDALAPAQVAVLVRALCDEAAACEGVREEIERRLEEAAELGASRRTADAERARAQREKADAERARRKELAERMANAEAAAAAPPSRAPPKDAAQKEREEEARALEQRRRAEQDAKLSVRGTPLGVDRDRRRYWWALGGVKGPLYVELPDGRWGTFAAVEELDALIDALDERGAKERALKAALEDRYQPISSGIARAAKAKEERDAPPPPAPAPGTGRYPQRERPEPKKAKGAREEEELCVDALHAGACRFAAENLEELRGLAEGAGAVRPGGWEAFAGAVKAATERPAALSKLMLELDDLLWDFAGVLENGSDAEEDEEMSEDDEDFEDEDKKLDDLDGVESDDEEQEHLWRTRRERLAWRGGAEGAAKAPGAAVAYSAAVLSDAATPFLEHAAKKRGKGGKGRAPMKIA